jgi:DMSO/TMAO reductase YedYZ heme-binding membrane subunit
MQIIIFIGVALFISLVFNKWIKKYPIIFYALAVIISLAGIFIPSLKPLKQGFLGLGFFIVMMYVGALNPKIKVVEKIMDIRSEISIIAFIILIAHVWNYFLQKGNLPVMFGILSFVIMIPLFITSFKNPDNQKKLKKWKKLHKLSYIVYALTLFHLYLVAKLPLNKIVYAIIFLSYLLLRVIKAFQQSKLEK